MDDEKIEALRTRLLANENLVLRLRNDQAAVTATARKCKRLLVGSLAALVVSLAAVTLLGWHVLIGQPQKLLEQNAVSFEGVSLKVDRVTARELNITDADGWPRFTIDTDQQNTFMYLYAKGIGPRIILSAGSQDAFVGIFSERNGSARLVTGVSEKTYTALGHAGGNAYIRMQDQEGVGRLAIGHTVTTLPDGTERRHPVSSIWLFGSDGKALWSAP